MNKETVPIWNFLPALFQSLSQKSPAKRVTVQIAQEEQLGLPYWTIILAICVVVDESKCLDTQILEWSNLWASSIFTWF